MPSRLSFGGRLATVNPPLALVEQIMAYKENEGGLGIRDIKLFNKALLAS